MILELPSPPRTMMEVYQMLPEGTLAELINGQLYMSPAPSNKHQWFLIALVKTLDDFVKTNRLGKILIAPSDVYLDEESNAVQPDLYFISNQNSSQPLEDSPYKGIPDLIVEILSVSNSKHDLVTKKNLYERFGIKEYWIVDPGTTEVSVFEYQNKAFKLISKEIGKAPSALLNHTFNF